MKNCILFILLIVRSICYAQENDDKKFTDVHFDYVQVKSSKEKINTPLQFSSIEVHDIRYDTSGIGLLQTSNFHVTIFKTKQSLAEDVKRYYTSLVKDFSASNNSPTLHCFIKKLILSDYINTAITTEEQRLSAEKFDLVEKSGMLLVIEFYISKDSTYYPLYRFDTTITGQHSIYNNAPAYLASGLSASLRKATLLDYSSVFSTAKKLSFTDINNFNKARNTFSILNNPPAKGLFLTFDDFRNNRATDKPFTIDKNKKGDFLYVKNEKNEEVLLTDLWGYSDGKDIFLFSANNYFKLYRIGNSFTLFGAKDFTNKRVLRLNFGLADLINPNSLYSKSKTRSKYELIKSFLQLDIESGELY